MSYLNLRLRKIMKSKIIYWQVRQKNPMSKDYKKDKLKRNRTNWPKKSKVNSSTTYKLSKNLNNPIS